VNVALIGLGMVAGTHLAALEHSGSLRLTGVMGRDSGRADPFARRAAARLGSPVSVYERVEDIAGDSKVDFVLIATPPDARLDLIRVLAKAKKPILLEKPIERDLAAATEIVTLCEVAGVPLGVILQHRARAASKALKTAISAGSLGDIATIDLRVPWWRAQTYYDAPGRGTYARDGGGVMITQAIHTLDLALWLAGPMTTVQSLMRQTSLHRLEAEDWAGALFEMNCGAVGAMVATTAAYPGAAESLSLQGSEGSAHLEAGVLTIEYLDGRTERVGETASTGGGADPMAFTHDWHQSVMEDFASALKSGKPPMASGRSALMAHAVIDAMQAANRTGQATEVARV
jgi:predicted dehydrogenase